MRLRTGEEGGAFVDLIERIGADHQSVVAAIDHGLGEGEQCFTGAVDRQHVARRVEPACRHAEAALAPVSDGFAQGRDAQGGWVDRHLLEIGRQRLGDEAWRAMFRLADRQGDGAFVGGGLHAAEQRAQFLERVGLELVQRIIHGWRVPN
ncbi:hypothetical protein D3C76_1017580 [compost metagenome]